MAHFLITVHIAVKADPDPNPIEMMGILLDEELQGSSMVGTATADSTAREPLPKSDTVQSKSSEALTGTLVLHPVDPFLTSGLSHHCHLDESTFILVTSGVIVNFNIIFQS